MQSRVNIVQMDRRRPEWLRLLPAFLLLAALAGIGYANSLPNGFVRDDTGLAASNPQVSSLHELQWMLRTGGWLTYRPLRTASYAIDYALFGLNPAGFRTSNILYHFLNGALLFAIFRALLRQSRPALLAAVLFIVHPVQTESVAYISGRRDVLFTLFYLTGIYGFIRYRETGRVRHLCLAGASYLLGLLTKEMAITLPLLWLCYDFIRSLPLTGAGSRSSTWDALKEGTRTVFQRNKWLYLQIGIAFVLLVYYHVHLFRVSLKQEMWGGGVWPTLLTSATIFAHYLKLMVFPMNLSADYSFNAFPISYSIAEARVIVACLILGVAWWGIYRLLAFDRWAAFGGLWFFLTLLPVSQLIPHHEIVAEHYLYLPSAGFLLAAALLAERLLRRSAHPRVIAVAFGLVVLLLGLRTVARNRDWKDDLTLWAKTTQTSPDSARAHIALAGAHLRRGHHDQARQELLDALRIQPSSAATHSDLGVILLHLGRLNEAEQEFREAMRLSGSSPALKVNLGLIYLGRSQFDEAEQQLREALGSPELLPSQRVAALNNLGLAYAKRDRQAEAEKAFNESLSIDPKNMNARVNLGLLYLGRGALEDGATQLEEAIRYNDPDATIHGLLGEVYYRLGRKEQAAAELTKALNIKSDFAEARALLDTIARERAGGGTNE